MTHYSTGRIDDIDARLLLAAATTPDGRARTRMAAIGRHLLSRFALSPERTRLVAGLVGAGGFVLATLLLLPEHVLGIEVLPETWDAFGDLGLLFAIAALLVRRPTTTRGEVTPAFTRGLLLGLLVAGFVGAAAALVGLWVHGGAMLALLAVTTLTLSVLPLRAFIGTRSDAVLFGGRDEAYGVLSALGRRVEEAGTPDELLAQVVHTVADTLHLAYVAVELDTLGLMTRVAAVGTPAAALLRFPLVHRGRAQGYLVVTAPEGQRLTAADRRLLHDLGTQIGSVAHAAQLVSELRRVNRRMIAARADERRRLRRDLHDGLGPLLAGIGLSAQAARNQIGVDNASATGLLDRIATESHHASGEVRRLLENLHPMALDRLGLVDALREKLDGIASGPTTEVVASGEFTGLPADVELAAYRIVLEAHTNIVRHSAAQHCRIEVERGDDLVLRVTDDGVGIQDGPTSGIGLASMAERAAELGGTCRISAGRSGGTRVEATIPLRGS